MGSGSKFTVVSHYDAIGLGLYISKFPFALTVNVTFLFWHISLGFGKGYDEN